MLLNLTGKQNVTGWKNCFRDHWPLVPFPRAEEKEGSLNESLGLLFVILFRKSGIDTDTLYFSNKF